MILPQPVRQAPVDPGKQNIKVALATPDTARDAMVEVPISSYDTARNTSPNPSISLSSKTVTASGVLSRPVMPVPPVVITALMLSAAIHCETAARIW